MFFFSFFALFAVPHNVATVRKVGYFSGDDAAFVNSVMGDINISTLEHVCAKKLEGKKDRRFACSLKNVSRLCK